MEAGLMSMEVILSVLVQVFWPRLVTKRVPGPLMSLIIVTAVHWIIYEGMGHEGEHPRTVSDYARESGGSGLAGEFPLPHWPYICAEDEYNATNVTNALNETTVNATLCEGFSGYTSELISDAIVLGVILCFVGLIESLLTLLLVNDKTETVGDSNRECLGQGTANMVSGIFQTMGGCAMIGQTLINVQAGSRLRVAGVVAALLLLVTAVGVPELLGIIPLGALVGVVIMIVVDTFEWLTFKWFFVLPWMDSVVIVVVTVLSVVTNLAVGVGVGIALQALVFSWSASSRAKVSSRQIVERRDEHDDGPTKIAHYVMKGPLFFGSSDLFQSKFVHMRDDPEEIVVHLDNVRVHDSSGLEALQNVAHKAEQLDKKLTFVISTNTKRVIDRSHDFLTSFEYVVTDDNPYYVCPRNLKCRRSCRTQRLGLCNCYHNFTRAFSTMWKRVASCHRGCCRKCCKGCCEKSCLEKEYGEPDDSVSHKAKIVHLDDAQAMKKLRIDFAFPKTE